MGSKAGFIMAKVEPVSDLKKFRLAKRLVTDLGFVLQSLDTTKKSLKEYTHFAPVRIILENLLRNEEILRIHFKRQKLVVENKGNIEDDTKS